MDDVLSGANSLEVAKTLQHQLIDNLQTAQMSLHKWCGNTSELIQTTEKEYDFASPEEIKTLGIAWKSKTDCFNFKVEVEQNAHPTKRSVLSIIARLFDPLGLLGPVITKAKIFMQQLWTLQIDWSERLPEKEASEWKEFVRSLVALNGINIERCIVIPNAEVIELHGFCDASERAYGAAIYARSINPNGEIKVKLVASKSRVSPIKQVTMPRLELCSAVLLAKLMHKVKGALRMDITSVFFWTDSTIVLSWMKNESRNLKTFVANRVVTIQQLTELNKWHQVPSEQNPADIISRGLDPEKIQPSELWWFGPAFLEVSSVNFPRYVDEIHNCAHYQRELKDNQESIFLVQNREILPIIDKCSSFLKLQRILAWCVRFKENARNPLQVTTGSLTVAELSTALICLVRNVQSVSFAKEIWCLERIQPLPVSSNLLTLSPFLDERKILCVGGRLKHSNLPAQQKHPILIPNNHSSCDLIIKHYHVLYLHTGTEATLANIRTRFWIVNGRSKVKGIQCLKVSAKGKNQRMADLPNARGSIARVFSKVGLDFCGPFHIKLISALTPAHFLTGSPLTSLPDPDFKGIPMNRLRRWELVQRMTQTFWSRWTLDYLNRLQSRPKWYKGNQKFKVNEVILVKGENNSKLLNWNLAKIIEVHPGTDDITRVVTLKTGEDVKRRKVTMGKMSEARDHLCTRDPVISGEHQVITVQVSQSVHLIQRIIVARSSAG
ncbi:integrase catalytic domain-containing protein [Trichonephila clavipes]|nr:integrase catalytic domain-containing protein [Trichonephila clavipes]